MRAGIALAAAMLLGTAASTASAQTSSGGLFSPGSFMATPSIFGNAAVGSRPGFAPFSNLRSATGFLPSFSFFQGAMNNRSASAPTVRFVTIPPPPTKK
jgi:hypothetical protein